MEVDPAKVSSRLRPAAQYVRMSTDGQQLSIVNQTQAIAAYAQAHGFYVVHSYSDEGRSGLNAAGRPALRKMLSDVLGSPGFEAILVYDVSRWGRFQDTDESAHYEYLCRSAGVPVHYCAEQLGTHGSLNNAILKAIKRAMAGEFSRELSEKVLRGQTHLAAMGYRQGGQSGFGLRRLSVSKDNVSRRLLLPGERKGAITDRVILIPGPEDEVALVRYIFKLFTNSRLPPNSVATHINSLCLPVYPGKWTRSKITGLLRNEAYIGNNVFGKTSFRLKTSLISNHPEKWVRASGVYEPIIDRPTFDHAQRILDYNSGRCHPRSDRVCDRIPGLDYQRPSTKRHIDGLDRVLVGPNGKRFYRNSGNGQGWTVRVRVGGVSRTKFFCDHKYGSAEMSRAAAEQAAASNEMIYKEILSLNRRLPKDNSPNPNGSGVTRVDGARWRAPHWLACWSEPATGKRFKQRFYIAEHGEDEARRLAVQSRESATYALKLRLRELLDQLRTDDTLFGEERLNSITLTFAGDRYEL